MLKKEIKYKEEIEKHLAEIRNKNKVIEDLIQQQNTEEAISYTRIILEELKKIKEKIEIVEGQQPQTRDNNTEENTQEITDKG